MPYVWDANSELVVLYVYVWMGGGHGSNFMACRRKTIQNFIDPLNLSHPVASQNFVVLFRKVPVLIRTAFDRAHVHTRTCLEACRHDDKSI